MSIQPTPVQLLTVKLKELEKARDKSVTFLKEGKITEDEHHQHMCNLTPLIENYRYVIRTINRYTDSL